MPSLESQIDQAKLNIKAPMTEFFAFVKKLFQKKPNAVELFLTLAASEISLKETRDALWDQMQSGLPEDFDRKAKQEMKRKLMEVAEGISSSPSIRLEAEKKVQSKIWTPEEKKIV